MISEFLHFLYHLDIYISVSNDRLRLKYKTIDIKTKEQIKQQKPLLIKRLKENDEAKKKGFLVYNYGDIYEFRYGLNSFLFIERLDNNKVQAWRANYRQDDSKPYKIKIISKDASFEEAFHKSCSFIDWLNRKNGRRYLA